MYEQVVILDKLSEKLGLYDKRESNKKLYPLDEYYVTKIWGENSSPSSEEFVKKMVTENNRFYGMMARVFSVYIAMSVLSGIGIIILLVVLL